MTEQTLDEARLNQWVGRQESASDIIDARQARLMETVLDQAPSLQDGDALPPLWHWLYFPTMTRQSDLGRDGHPKLGGFLPPVALPRRMWAGGRFAFLSPIPIGAEVTKTSTITSVKLKRGRSGDLCFVTVNHLLSLGARRCLSEDHDIVYRQEPSPDAPAPTPPEAPKASRWHRDITPDPVLLFRYSALTFNGHRIHYDRSFCTDEERYEGLVFHGPLTATLLADLATENNPGRRLASFDFRAVSPLFDTAPFRIAGTMKGPKAVLWAQNPAGGLAMQAEAVFD